MNVSFEVRGLSELNRFLASVPDEIEKKMAYGALMGAATPILDQAKQNIRSNFGDSVRYTGTLERAMVRGRNRRTGYTARVDIKIRRARTRGRMVKTGAGGRPVIKEHGDDAFYGRFLEFGTSKMPAYPFLRPAANVKAGEAARRFRDTLTKRMAKWCRANGVTFRSGTGGVL